MVEHAMSAKRRVRQLCMWGAIVGLQVVAARHGWGLPTFLVLTIVVIVVFGTRDKWDGEASAYSVFNDGRRLPGQFTAEQFDAQLRGSPQVDAAPPAGHRLGSTTSSPPQPIDRDLRRRLLADAAQRRAQQE